MLFRSILQAKDKIRELDPKDPQYQARVWETVLDARLASQRRTMPDREPRLLTKSEAQNLIPMPPGTKFTDPAFKTIMAKAADTAQQRFGPAYAKKALEDAIRWTITGDDEKRVGAGLIAKIAVGEPITMQDIRRQQMLEESQRMGVLPNGNWLKAWRDAPDDRDAEGQAGGFYGPAPTKRENPFKKYAPAR